MRHETTAGSAVAVATAGRPLHPTVPAMAVRLLWWALGLCAGMILLWLVGGGLAPSSTAATKIVPVSMSRELTGQSHAVVARERGGSDGDRGGRGERTDGRERGRGADKAQRASRGHGSDPSERRTRRGDSDVSEVRVARSERRDSSDGERVAQLVSSKKAASAKKVKKLKRAGKADKAAERAYRQTARAAVRGTVDDAAVRGRIDGSVSDPRLRKLINAKVKAELDGLRSGPPANPVVGNPRAGNPRAGNPRTGNPRTVAPPDSTPPTAEPPRDSTPPPDEKRRRIIKEKDDWARKGKPCYPPGYSDDPKAMFPHVCRSTPPPGWPTA